MGFYVDEQSYLTQPLPPDYETDQYVDCYRTLTCIWNVINVNQNDYVEGYCVYVLEIDLTVHSISRNRDNVDKKLSLLSPYQKVSP